MENHSRLKLLLIASTVLLLTMSCVLARAGRRLAGPSDGPAAGTGSPTVSIPTEAGEAQRTSPAAPSTPSSRATLGPGALSQVANSMEFVQLANAEQDGAVCNDGSPGGYYIRRGVGQATNTWIIHLQGGGHCNNDESCAERSRELSNLMSSRGAPQDRPGNGIHSTSPQDNPAFYNVTQVYIPYCSSDLWSGRRSASPATNGRHFRGHVIFWSVIDALKDPSITPEPTLAEASKVLLSGSSAGGLGVLVQLDRLAQDLPAAEVKGLTDAGWFVDIPPFDPQAETFARQAQLGFDYWQATVDDSCAQAQSGEQGRCYMGPIVYSELNTPLFVQIAQFDAPQLSFLGVDRPVTQEKRAYIEEFATAVRQSLQPVEAAFSPRTFSHGILLDAEFWRNNIQGTPLRVLVGNWFLGRAGPTKLIQQP